MFCRSGVDDRIRMAKEDTVNLVFPPSLGVTFHADTQRVSRWLRLSSCPKHKKAIQTRPKVHHHDSPMDDSSLAPGGWASFV